MSWKSLVDTFLAGTKREREIEVENQSDYDKWLSELYSEIEVFVKRVNNLDLEESEERGKFYDFIGKFSTRLQDLRERSESSGAPATALIEMDELVEMLEDTSAPISVAVASLDNDPFKEARRERRRKEREQNKIERARDRRDEIANQIQQVTSALEPNS